MYAIVFSIDCSWLAVDGASIDVYVAYLTAIYGKPKSDTILRFYEIDYYLISLCYYSIKSWINIGISKLCILS